MHYSCSCKVIRKKQCQTCETIHFINVVCGTIAASCKNSKMTVNAKSQKKSGNKNTDKDKFLRNREKDEKIIPQL